MTEKGEVVLTDSPEEARTLQKSIPVIGICSSGSDKDWSGISFLADDWEDVDDDYAELAGLTEEEDLNEPTIVSMKKRLPWLIALLFLGMAVSSLCILIN